MNLTRRGLFELTGLLGAGLASCSRRREEEKPKAEKKTTEEEPAEPKVDLDEFEALALDMDAWSYDEENDCYYQLAVPYCLTPGSTQYESLSIFVPGPYFQGTKKGRNWSCTVDEQAQVGEFTPLTAPVGMPINSPSCSAQECPTSYSYEGLGRYLQAGIVYVYAGFRGRSGGYESTTQEYFSGGAPWPVADLKAAIRYLRYNAAVLPCNAARIFVFGQGGGAGVGASLGVSGNSALYDPYLAQLGAATHDAEGNALSDALYGQASWCPVGVFGSADAAYEWMMGAYDATGGRTEGTWTKLLSEDLAQAYGDYVNELELVDADGLALRLDRIEDGSYAGGGYYQRMVDEVADAAHDFFGRTEFPYAAVPLGARTRYFPGNPSLHSSAAAAADDGEATTGIAGVRQIKATVYDNLESYVAWLNGDNRWLTYYASTGDVDITGLWGFVGACRQPSRDVCAYDLIDRSGTANQLFGTDDQPTLHFSPMVAKLVEAQRERYAAAEGWNDDLVAEWRGDLAEVDALGLSVLERVRMSDPLVLLAEQEEDAFEVAPHWRINTGLFQSETTLAGELNLAVALEARADVASVAFCPVWEAGYGLVEREGDPEDNLVAWMIACCASKEEAGEKSDAAAGEEGESSS